MPTHALDCCKACERVKRRKERKGTYDASLDDVGVVVCLGGHVLGVIGEVHADIELCAPNMVSFTSNAQKDIEDQPV